MRQNLFHVIKKIIAPKSSPAKYYWENYRGVKIGKKVTFAITSVFQISDLLRDFTIGTGFVCKDYCSFLIYPDSSLIIGENVFFNNYCSINCLESIEIGNDTMFGEGVKLYDHNHQYIKKDGILKIEKAKFNTGRIKIGSNCWIASNVTILKNVEIGNNCIIGANCLIYKNVPPNSILKSTQTLTIETRNEMNTL